jgi:group II intron reverse transcriptase/maturase
VLIPKRGKPGKYRPLGIPTVKDRVVQAALLQILEPIFEAGFLPVSYGFRPRKACRDALEHIRISCRPYRERKTGRWRKAPYQWAIEGDIKGCFDNIDHHALMTRLRSRIADKRICRLVLAFLKAGILEEETFLRTDSGTPQGGILSPLLANIVLSKIEERYTRWVAGGAVQPKTSSQANQARAYDRKHGRTVFMPIRYADDFVVLVNGTETDAKREVQNIGCFLKEELSLDLSEEKTLITPLQKGFVFLGHRFCLRKHDITGVWPRLEIPKERVKDLRYRIKLITKGGHNRPLRQIIQELNRVLAGWGYFFRHCTGANRIFAAIDHYVAERLWRWLRRKFPKAATRGLYAKYFTKKPDAPNRRRASDGNLSIFLLSSISVARHSLAFMRYPDYAIMTGEPDA